MVSSWLPTMTASGSTGLKQLARISGFFGATGYVFHKRHPKNGGCPFGFPLNPTKGHQRKTSPTGSRKVVPKQEFRNLHPEELYPGSPVRPIPPNKAFVLMFGS